MAEARGAYKERVTEVMKQRNGYRDMISVRKDKEKALNDILELNNIDLNALTKAVDEAKTNLVREEVVKKGEKMLEWLQYCKGVEQQLQQAVAEKSGEKLKELMARIDKENIVIDAKAFKEAQTTMSKLKI